METDGIACGEPLFTIHAELPFDNLILNIILFYFLGQGDRNEMCVVVRLRGPITIFDFLCLLNIKHFHLDNF